MIRPATLRDMTFIAANMRDADRVEIAAVYPGRPDHVAYALHAASPGMAWTAWLGGPVAAFGISPMFAGVGSAWAYGTKDMPKVMRGVTRFIRRGIAPMLLGSGYRRIEIRTSIDHDISHRWLESLGFVREGTAVDYGDGLDFVTYAARKRDWA